MATKKQVDHQETDVIVPEDVSVSRNMLDN